MFLRSAKAILRVLVAGGALTAPAVPVARPAVAQEVALATGTGGPRFLYASSKSSRPVEVDVSRTTVLRRRVSLTLARPTVGALLASIARQAELEFVYSREDVPVDRVVGLRADSITVAAALTEILVDTGLDVLLSPGRQVALVERRTVGVALETGSVVGRVTDAKTGAAIAGADVFLSGTRWRATADSAGRYRLADVDTGSYTITARRLGYTRQNRRVVVRAEQTDTIDFALGQAPVALDELVTTATGKQRRRDIGNAITTIKADSVLRTAPIRTLTDLLENRVTGLTVQHTSGAPGDPARLRLRGLRSIRQSNDPVVIVDGVRIYAAQSAARSGNLTNLGGRDQNGNVLGDASGKPITTGDIPAPSPLDQIDPNIIETIEVFKGASAATLYGPDAANGVIVITTKRGKPGPTRWTAEFQHGFTDTPGRWPEGYYRFGHAPFYRGDVTLCPLAVTDCIQDSLVRFQALNQADLTVLGRGRLTKASLTASGGTQALTYRVTGTFADELGLLTLPGFEAARFQERFNRATPDWMARPHHYKDWSVTSSVRALLGRTADVTLSTMLFGSEQQRSDLENKISTLAGTYVDRVHDLYYTPGQINYQCIATCQSYTVSRNSDYLQEYYRHTTASSINITTALDGRWYPKPWFTANGQASLNVVPREDQLLIPPGLMAPTDSGTLVRGTGRALVSTVNVNGNLSKPLGHGFIFQTSLGANVITTTVSDVVSSGQGLVLGTSTLSGASRVWVTENRDNNSVFGWFVEPRITGQRLSLSTGIRLDGGSAYGARVTGYGPGGGSFLRGLLALPKLNGSWVISEEPWFPFTSLFSSLRLRGSYGQSQTQPSTTDRLRLYTRSIGELGEQLALTTVGNTHLRPERSIEFDGGFDADLFDNRVSVELTGYHTTQIDALQPVTLPGSVNGGGKTMLNIGNIRNRGIELKLGLTPVRLPAVTWTAELLYSSNSNTLVKLGRGVTPNPQAGIVEGYPLFGRWAKPILGYADQNGDGLLQPYEVRVGDSLVYMGQLAPAYQTALRTSAALLGGAVRLDASFKYDAGATQVNPTVRTNWVLARAVADPSTPLIEQAAVVVLDSTDYGVTQDVSTFRFNTVSVTYQAPQRVARLLRAQKLSVALQGSNLGVHSTYHGKDPDVSAWSPTETVVDTGQLPTPRTWQLAFFLDF